jgi:sulfate permease, SulP family
MLHIITKIKSHCKEFVPKSLICFREGYTSKLLYQDLFAGICVGIIAIPLALAFAIASGVTPEKGVFTAIIAGFLISCLGGSRVQIGGPTGAFVVVIYSTVVKFGYEGLAIATLIAAFLIILMGFVKFGTLLKFIPHPVTIGFTTGIAIVIFSSQIKDFLGLSIDLLPPDVIGKYILYGKALPTWNGWALATALSTLLCIVLFKRYAPRVPGVMIAIGLATLVVTLFHLPIETIGSKFGEIRTTLPKPSLPPLSFDLFFTLFPSAVTIALLGAIESLLSASVADGMTGQRHRSNCELVAQGLANLGSVIFGGIPATGAVARTSANIKLGAKTPVAGMVHALTILLLMLFFAPLVGKIPLAALSAVLVFVAWNMAEFPHFIEILKGQRGDALVLLMTFACTILIDLTVAGQVGVLLSAVVFLKRMTDRTTLESYSAIKDDEQMEKIPSEIAIFEMNGPFFYSVRHLLEEALLQVEKSPKVFVLNLQKTPLIDFTGFSAIKQFSLKCKQKKILLFLAGAKPGLLSKSNIEDLIGKDFIFPTVDSALLSAKNYID